MSSMSSTKVDSVLQIGEDDTSLPELRKEELAIGGIQQGMLEGTDGANPETLSTAKMLLVGNISSKKKKRKRAPSDWIDVDKERNKYVYVSGLPSDISENEYLRLMSQIGPIAVDRRSTTPKLKLYKNVDGTNKGDARCCFQEVETVEKAFEILNGKNIRGYNISVQRAEFQRKGTYEPAKKHRKLSAQNGRQGTSEASTLGTSTEIERSTTSPVSAAAQRSPAGDFSSWTPFPLPALNAQQDISSVSVCLGDQEQTPNRFRDYSTVESHPNWDEFNVMSAKHVRDIATPICRSILHVEDLESFIRYRLDLPASFEPHSSFQKSGEASRFVPSCSDLEYLRSVKISDEIIYIVYNIRQLKNRVCHPGKYDGAAVRRINDILDEETGIVVKPSIVLCEYQNFVVCEFRKVLNIVGPPINYVLDKMQKVASDLGVVGRLKTPWDGK